MNETRRRNIRLKIAYDGTPFCGWQRQSNGRGVQEEIESAVERLTQEKTTVHGAGRTDAGVHAIGQVASFTTASRIPVANFLSGLQTYVAPEILIRSVEEVPDSFHAQYSARRKRYRYLINNEPFAFPFLRNYCWRIKGDLDAAAMQQGADHLLGTHDFRSFESHWPNKLTSIRTVEEVRVQWVAEWPVWTETNLPLASGGRFLAFDIVADGFLYNMVRSIMGTLVNVGRGKWPPEAVGEIRAALDRRVAGKTAPPQGLYLMSVDYDPLPPDLTLDGQT